MCVPTLVFSYRLMELQKDLPKDLRHHMFAVVVLVRNFFKSAINQALLEKDPQALYRIWKTLPSCLRGSGSSSGTGDSGEYTNSLPKAIVDLVCDWSVGFLSESTAHRFVTTLSTAALESLNSSWHRYVPKFKNHRHLGYVLRAMVFSLEWNANRAASKAPDATADPSAISAHLALVARISNWRAKLMSVVLSDVPL